MRVEDWKTLICNIFEGHHSVHCVLLRPFDGIDRVCSVDDIGQVLFCNCAEAYAFVDVDDKNLIHNTIKHIEHSEETALINNEQLDVILLFSQGHNSMEVFGDIKKIKRIIERIPRSFLE